MVSSVDDSSRTTSGSGTPTGPTAAVSAVRRLGVGFGGDERLRQLQPLHGVVGGGQDLVGQLADVLDQPLALLPEQAGVHHHLLGVIVGLAPDLVGLGVGLPQATVGFGLRTGGQGIGGRVGALEDARSLDSHVVQGLLHGALARLVGLELGHQRAHTVDELVHGSAVVATHRKRKAHLAQPLGG